MIKVASYCRVSTDSQDQANSFASQQRFFREYINRHPDWELYEVYADEGVTGTSTKKRTQFNRMINDAYHHKFNLILTKEVSRFSRNLLDTIAYTRELKTLGIGVIFMNDGFSSLDPDSELRLSIMGSIAQEESRKTSSRVKWGQTRQMERGVVFGPSLLGYDVQNGRMTVNQEGADIVRQIFYKYAIEKKGISVIARELRQAGFRTITGNPNWSASHIIKILHNEKYVGDLVQKKSITVDYLSHTKKTNRGEEELIVLRDHHEPIIDRTLWETAQAELLKRNKHSNQSTERSKRYVFSGKIICGECGARFVSRHKKQASGKTVLRWGCYTAVSRWAKSIDTNGNQIGCNIGKTIRDDLAADMLTAAILRIPADFDWMMQNLVQIVTSVMRGAERSTDNAGKQILQIRQFNKKKEAAIDAYISGIITQDELFHMKEQYDSKIEFLRNQLQVIQKSDNETSDEMDKLIAYIQSTVTCRTNSDAYYKAVLKHMIIHKDGTVAIYFNHIPQIFHFSLQYRRRQPESESK